MASKQGVTALYVTPTQQSGGPLTPGPPPGSPQLGITCFVANELRVRPQCMKKREFDHFGGHLGALYPSPLTYHHKILMRCCFRPGQHSRQNSSRWVQPFLHNARASRQRTDRRRADRRQNCFCVGRALYGRPKKSTSN